MALLRRGRFKDKQCEIHQWCNDWFAVMVNGTPLIVSPVSLVFTREEMAKIIAHENNGILFRQYFLDTNNRVFIKRKKFVLKGSGRVPKRAMSAEVTKTSLEGK